MLGFGSSQKALKVQWAPFAYRKRNEREIVVSAQAIFHSISAVPYRFHTSDVCRRWAYEPAAGAPTLNNNLNVKVMRHNVQCQLSNRPGDSNAIHFAESFYVTF